MPLFRDRDHDNVLNRLSVVRALGTGDATVRFPKLIAASVAPVTEAANSGFLLFA